MAPALLARVVAVRRPAALDGARTTTGLARAVGELCQCAPVQAAALLVLAILDTVEVRVVCAAWRGG
jgi:hypothetical protein